ncbi:MAG: tandem-95 repeat protein [Phreatobacter sp.]|uniref:tandem-95 repeat protein n=1 Tax=Phreatobacter sp. TaxID=1966341 RepID=UPI004036965D
MANIFTGTGNTDTFSGLDSGGFNFFYFTPSFLQQADQVTGSVQSAINDILLLTEGGSVSELQLSGVRRIEKLEFTSTQGNNVVLTNALASTALNSNLSVVANAGNDTINASALEAGSTVSIFANGGTDTVITGAGTTNHVYSNVADFTAADVIQGGSGTDWVILDGAGTVEATAFQFNKSGLDKVVLRQATNVTLHDAAFAPSQIEVVAEGAFNNVVDGTALTKGLLVISRAAPGGGTSDGTDTFIGGSGQDFFVFTTSDLNGDVVRGNGGIDFLVFQANGVYNADRFVNTFGIESINLQLDGAGSTIQTTNQLVSTADQRTLGVWGTTSVETIDGSQVTVNGAQMLVGGGGADVIRGGSTNDWIRIGDGSFAEVNGNSGFNRLETYGNNIELDLTTMSASRLQNIQAIDMRNQTDPTGVVVGQNSRLTLTVDDLARVSGNYFGLYVLGDGDDVVNAGAGWTLVDTNHANQVFDGITFLHYRQNGYSLYIQADIGTATVQTGVVNQAPVVDLNGLSGAGFNETVATYTTGTAAVKIAANASITDADVAAGDQIAQMTVAISNATSAGEALGLSAAGAAIATSAGISVSFAAGTLTLSGAASVGQYESLLREVQYSNPDVSSGLNTANRSLVVTVVDSRGDSSTARTVTVPVAQGDGVAPAAPAISGISTDTGTAGDGVTGDNTLVVSGTAEPGSTVSIFNGSVLVGTATADGGGAFAVTLSQTLADGAYGLTATAADAAGNTSVASAVFAVSIDTKAPNPPVLIGFLDDTGVAGDGRTSDTTPTLLGTAEAGSTVSIFDGSTLIGTVVATGAGTFAFTVPGALGDGTYAFSAQAADAAGNLSAPSASLSLTIDATAPAAPAIGSITPDSGVTGDGITNTGTVVVSGTAEAGSTVTIFSGSAPVGSAVANPDGTYAASVTLGSGSNALTATATDAAGNTSAPSASVALTVDTTAPAVTSLALESIENQTLAGVLTATDANGPVTFSMGSGADSALFTIVSANQLRFLSAPDFEAPADGNGDNGYVANIVATDAAGNRTFVAVNVTVGNVNEAPTATTDQATTTEDTAVGINVSANDTDPDAGTLLGVTAASVRGGAAVGSVVFAGGSVTFTPATNFNGTAIIDYTVSDGGFSAASTATVAVTPVNDAPVAVGNNPTVIEDTPTTLNLLANDTDVENQALSIGQINGNAITVGQTVAVAGGTVLLNANQTLTFTPTANSTAASSFTYTARDSQGAESAPATVNVTITPVNDAPVATGAVGSTTTDEDTILNGSVAATDVDGTIASYALVGAPPFGLVFNADGTYSYDPRNTTSWLTTGQTAQVSFAYKVVDDQGAESAPQVVTLLINGVNDAPTANTDFAGVTESNPPAISTANGGLLFNDSDSDGGTLAVASLAGGTDNGATITVTGTYGTLTVTKATGAYQYVLDNTSAATNALKAGQSAPDQFTYTVSDGQGGTATSTLTVNVFGTNDAPVVPANAGTPQFNQVAGESAVLTVASADGLLKDVTDVDGTSFSNPAGPWPRVTQVVDVTTNVVTQIPNGGTVVLTLPGGGKLTIGSDGAYSFNPDGQYEGLKAGEALTETVRVVISDGAPGGDVGRQLNIRVDGENDAPVLGSLLSTETVAEDNQWTFTVPANAFSDIDGDALTLSATLASGAPLPSWLTFTGSTFVGQPPQDFNGTIDLKVTASDGSASASQTFSLDVMKVNDAPVVTGPVVLAPLPEDASVAINAAQLLANASDVDGDPLTVSGLTASAGTVFDNGGGNWSYTPAADFNGPVTFSYMVSDGTAAPVPASATLTVTAANDAPVVSAPVALADLAEDGTMVLTVAQLLGNASDVDGDTLTIAGLTPSSGAVVDNGNGSWTYTPPANFNGAVTFFYTVSDGTAAPVPASASLTVTAVNDAPVVTGPVVLAPLPEDASVAINAAQLLANASDVDGDTLTVSGLTASAGTVFDNGGGNWSYTPAADFNGPVTFSFMVSDGTAPPVPASATLTVTAANDAPVVSAPVALADLAEDGTRVLTVAQLLGNASDVDGNALTIAGLTPSSGAVVDNGNGSWTYTPAADFNGAVTFSYTVSDGTAAPVPASATLTVTPVNDAPVVGTVIPGQSVDEDAPWSFIVPTGAFTDVDGDTLTLSATLGNGDPLPSWLTFTGSTFSGQPPQDFNGTLSLKVTAADASTSASQTFTLTVSPLNDAPVLTLSPTSLAPTPSAIIGVFNANLLDAGTGIVDVDSPVQSVTLTLAVATGVLDGNLDSNEAIYLEPAFADALEALGYTVDFTATSTLQTLTITSTTGGVSPAQLEGILENVKYANTDTSFSFNPEDRVVTVTVTDDGGLTSAPQVLTLDLAANVTDWNNVNAFTGSNRDDFIRGLGGNDVLDGGAGNDTLEGGANNDTLTGGTGNDTLRGGTGVDTAVYDGDLADYTVGYTPAVGGFITSFGSVTGGPDGDDTLSSVERLQFDDVTLELSAPVQLFNGSTLVGTFSTIADAVAASAEGYKILVSGAGGPAAVDYALTSETITIPHGLTLIALGPVTVASITVNGSGGDVVIDNVDVTTTGDYGVYVDPTATYDSITFQNGNVTGGVLNGFAVNVADVDVVTIENAIFSNNGTNPPSDGRRGEGAILFEKFNGDVTLSGVTVDAPGAGAENGIQIRGDYPGSAIAAGGTITLTNVNVTGAFSSTGIAIRDYLSLVALAVNTVGVNVTGTAYAGLHLDNVGGSFDLSDIGAPGLSVSNGGTNPTRRDIQMDGVTVGASLTGDASNDLLVGAAGGHAMNGGDGSDTYLVFTTTAASSINDTGTPGVDSVLILGGENPATPTLADGGTDDTLTVVFNGTAITSVNGATVSGIEAIGTDLGTNAAAGDTLSYAGSSAGVTVDLSTGTATGFNLDLNGPVAGVPSVLNVENVTGGAGDDTITGNAGNNVLVGGGGADTITGGAGNNTIVGGADSATDDSAADTAVYGAGATIGWDDTTKTWTVTHSDGVSTFTDKLDGIEKVVIDGKTTWLVDQDGNSSLSTIGSGVSLALTGHTVLVADGDYAENVTLGTSGVTLLSANGRGVTTITGQQAGAEQGAVYVTGGVNDIRIGDVGKGFTIIGLNGNGASEKGAVYLQGAHDEIDIVGNDIRANGDAGLMSEFGNAVTDVRIDRNIFSGQTFTGSQPGGTSFATQFDLGNNVPRQLVVMGDGGGATASTPAQRISFTNNQVTGTAGGISVDGGQPFGNTLVTIDANGSVIQGNTFTGLTAGNGFALRVRGPDTDVIDNTLDHTTGGDSRGIFVDNKGIPGTYSGNTVLGDGATDVIRSMTPGADLIQGGAGDDFLAGGAGGDTFQAGGGNDVIVIENAANGTGDSIDGGVDSDTIRLVGTVAETYVLGAGVTNVERVEIAAADGNATGTVAIGIDASAVGTGLTLVGNAGDNTFIGTAEADTIEGGAGLRDTVVYAGNASAYTIAKTAEGTFTVTETVSGKVDTLRGIEFVQFADKVAGPNDNGLNGIELDANSPSFSGATLRFDQKFTADLDGITASTSTVTLDTTTSLGGVTGFARITNPGAFTRFDGYRNALDGGIVTTARIYLDTAVANTQGFDLSVAANNTSSAHLRDFIFHVTKSDAAGGFLIAASNNTNGSPRQDLATFDNVAKASASGWYTFEHRLYPNEKGDLEVALNVYDGLGNWIFTEVRTATTDDVGTVAGGNRYMWFTANTITGGIAVDEITLKTLDGNLIQLYSGNTILDSFTTVQAAANAAAPGNIIDFGAYAGPESVTVNVENLTFRGPDGSDVNLTLGGTVQTVALAGAADIDVTGNASDNTIVANAGDNVIDGAGGTDTVSYAGATAPVVVDLSDNVGSNVSGGSGADTLVNVENVIGTSGADTFTGDGNANTFTTNGGSDTVRGGSGTDTVVLPGSLNDYVLTVVQGGSGNYVFTQQAPAGSAVVSVGFDVEFAGSTDLSKNVFVLNASGRLVGTYDTISAAVGDAVDGQTLLIKGLSTAYSENVIVDKALTLVGIDVGNGAPTVSPASGTAFTLTATGLADITIDNVDIAGGATGIAVAGSAAIDTLTVTNGSISGASTYGLFVDGPGPNPGSVAEVVVKDMVFGLNGAGGAANTAQIKLWGFDGKATIENVTIAGAAAGALDPARPDNAIEITGQQNPVGADAPNLGTVAITNVTVTGSFHKNPVAVFNISEIDGLSIAGLDLTGATSSWGPLVNIDGVEDDAIDVSGYGITFPGSYGIVTEIQGEKFGQDAGETTITGTSLADRLIGKTGNDILLGGAGDDQLYGADKPGQPLAGEAGNDRLEGGAGDDYLNGGAETVDGLAIPSQGDVAVYRGATQVTTANLSLITSTDPVNGASFDGWQVNATGLTPNQGTDRLNNVEIIENVDAGGAFVSRILLVGNGGFDSIQAAIDEAVSGDTVLVASGTWTGDVTVAGKAITIAGFGDDGLAPTIIKGQITVSDQLNGAFTLKDVAVDAVGESYGVFVSSHSTGNGSVTLDGVSISGAQQNGFAYIRAGNGSTPVLSDTIEAVSFLNSKFSNNATLNTGSGGRGDIMLFGYNGDVTVVNTTISNPGSQAQKAFQMRGVQAPTDVVGVGPYAPAGDVDLRGLTVNGTYAQDMVAFYRIADFDSLLLTGTSLNGTAPWGLFNADSVGGVIDASGIVSTNTGGLFASLQALTGVDTLTGTVGSDLLNGRIGADVMAGGLGGDTYRVDNALDVVTEATGGGSDTVLASVNYALATGTEVEFLTSAGTGLTLTGNELAQTITGDAGVNLLNGGGGNDILIGLGGGDTFDGGAGNDTFYGGTALVDDDNTVIDTVTYGAGATIAWDDTLGAWKVTEGGDTDTLYGIEKVLVGGAVHWLVDGAANGGLSTIGEALDQAGEGHVVHLANGTYAGNVTINESVTILGPNGTVLGRDQVQDTGARITGTITVAAAAGKEVSLQGLEFRNLSDNATSAHAIVVTGAADLTVRNNLFWSTGPNGNHLPNADFGVFLQTGAGGDITITGNAFTGASQAGFSTASWRAGVWSDGAESSLTITSNLFQYTRSGLNLDFYNDTTSTVSGNSFVSSGSGISMGAAQDVATITNIINNTFENVGSDFNLGGVTTAVTFDATATANGAPASGVAAPVIDPTGVLSIIGGGQGDTITGSAGVDMIEGRNGFDTLKGGAGNDLLLGGENGETYTGATGEGDVAVYDATTLTFATNAADTDPVTTGIQPGWTVTAGGGQGTDTLSGIEIVQNGAARTLLVGNGAFDSIQAAIKEAQDGDTIAIAAGTYVEQIIVDGLDNITFVAIGGEVIIKAPIDVVETARSSSDREMHSVVTVLNGTNIVFNDITVDGDGRANTIDEGGGTGPAQYTGVFYRNASGSLIDVDIKGVRDPYPGGATLGGEPVVSGNQRGVALQVDNNTQLAFTMTGGSISDFQKNATVFNNTNLTVTGVTITGGGAQTINAQNGIQVLNSTGTISGNTITKIGYAGPAAAYSAGILAYGNTNLAITGNTVTGSNGVTTDAKVVGIYVLDFGTANSGGSVTGNTISQVDTGVVVTGNVSPTQVAVSGNIISDIDVTDPYAAGVSHDPNPGLATVFDVSGSGLADELFGAAGNDTLTGLGGNDLLDGRAGIDIMIGGLGDDTYRVDNALDVVTEATGGGSDTVLASVNYALAAGTEVEFLTSAGSGLTLTGNELAQTITGDAGVNILNGGGGNDILIGLGGGDTFDVGAGNDTYYGGTALADDANTVIDTASYGATATIAWDDTLGAWKVTEGGDTDTLYGVEKVTIGGAVHWLVDGTANGGLSTIASALALAGASDTVHLASGNFAENLTISTGVTILGTRNGVATSAVSRDASTGVGESTISGQWTIATTAGVVIDGLRFENVSPEGVGSDASLTFNLGGAGAGHAVRNTIFWSALDGGDTAAVGVDGDAVRDDRAIHIGVGATTGTITVEDNLVTGSLTGKFGTASWGRAIWADYNGAAIVIDGNTFEYVRSALNMDRTSALAAEPTITGNTFKDAGTAITFGGGVPTASAGLATVGTNSFVNVDTEFNLRNLTSALDIDLQTKIGSYSDAVDDHPATGDFFYAVGNASADTIKGSAEIDWLEGRAGNDVLEGRGGNDVLDGGDGFDQLKGGAGDDLLVGGETAEVLTGAPGEGDVAVYDATITKAMVTSGTVDADPGPGVTNVAGWTVTTGGTEGTDTLVGVEIVQNAGARILLVGNGGFSTIQAAIDEAQNGDTILIANSGTSYAGAVVNKSGITIMGESEAGVVIEGNDTGIGLKIVADNVEIASLTVKNFMHGIQIGDTYASQPVGGNETRTGIKITDVSSIDNGAPAPINTDVFSTGLNVGEFVNVSNVTITNSSFDGNWFGMYLANGAATNTAPGDDARASTFSGLTVTNTTFNENWQKGIYAEKLSNAVFDDIEVVNSGKLTATDAPAFSVSRNSGIDINLKYLDFANITIKDSLIRDSGRYVMNLNNNPALPDASGAITIKARDDASSYNNNPATLNGLTLTGNTIENTITTGPRTEVGIRLGEAGKVNTTPTGVAITGNTISGIDIAFTHATTQPIDLVALLAANTVIGTPNDVSSAGTREHGNDLIVGADPSGNAITGGKGNDHLVGAGGNDLFTWNSGDGTDTVVGAAGTADTLAINGGATAETFTVDNTSVTSSAGGGVTHSGIEIVTVDGGAGNDTVAFTALAGGPQFQVNGGADTDTLDFSAVGSGVTASLSTGTFRLTGNALVHTEVGVENLVGTASVDELTGDNGANRLVGGGGADTIVGLDGADVLVGGDGADGLEGGTGADQFHYLAASHAGDTLFGYSDAENDSLHFDAAFFGGNAPVFDLDGTLSASAYRATDVNDGTGAYSGSNGAPTFVLDTVSAGIAGRLYFDRTGNGSVTDADDLLVLTFDLSSNLAGFNRSDINLIS